MPFLFIESDAIDDSENRPSVPPAGVYDQFERPPPAWYATR
ncbi:hypothetical protein [Streptomyces sp. NPDC002758]